jgi:UDP-N-acetylglucosamine 3-dehydrogenase
MTLRVGIVGTGAPNTGLNPEEVTKAGFSVAYRHAPCYRELDDTELVGCVDLVEENRDVFAETFDLPAENAYEGHLEMVEELDLDFVDVCTPAATHADIAVDLACCGEIDAIHSEKPMASTWGDAQRMATACWRRGVQLTFNHQRRFGDPFRRALALLESGEIGALERMEISPGAMFSYGTHAVDLCGMYNGERPAEWVIGQIDYRTENVYSKGGHNENQVVAQWEYDNGVHCFAGSGGAVDAHHRLVGTGGVIEVGPRAVETDLRIRRHGQTDWETIETGENGLGGLHNGYPYMVRAIGDAVDALLEGYESELSARVSLNTAEIIFATYESSRRRGRVDLPTDITDNPLEAMVESGALNPEPADEE